MDDLASRVTRLPVDDRDVASPRPPRRHRGVVSRLRTRRRWRRHRGARIGRDVEDWVVPVFAHVPRAERATVPLGGGERLELVADARLGLVTDLEPMTAASSAGTAPSWPAPATAARAPARRPGSTCRRGAAARTPRVPAIPYGAKRTPAVSAPPLSVGTDWSRPRRRLVMTALSLVGCVDFRTALPRCRAGPGPYYSDVACGRPRPGEYGGADGDHRCRTSPRRALRR